MVDRKTRVARDMRRQVLGAFCVSGVFGPPLVMLKPILPIFADPGAGTIVLLVLALAVLYVIGEAFVEWASRLLLGFPPLVRLATWAEAAPADTSGRWRRYLHVATALGFYWSIGIGAAIAIYASGVVPKLGSR